MSPIKIVDSVTTKTKYKDILRSKARVLDWKKKDFRNKRGSELHITKLYNFNLEVIFFFKF